MSISHKELIALRRAALLKQQSKSAKVEPQPQPSLNRSQPEAPRAVVFESSPRRTVRSEGAGVVPKSLEPKIMAPTITPQGAVSRAELVRRSRVSYDEVSVEALLVESGVDVMRLGTRTDSSSGYHALLPLEAFDDFSWDERSPRDWLALGLDEHGDQRGIPAIAVNAQEGQQTWSPCRVREWNEVEHRLLIEWSHTPSREWLPRIFVYFRAEDPHRFVKRVVSAHERRVKAESLLRHALYVDAMPPDEQDMLDPAVVSRIRGLSLNTASLQRCEDVLDVATVLGEVQRDYRRAMNLQTFIDVASRSSLDQFFQGVPMPTPPPPPEVPALAKVAIPTQTYGGAVKALHANALFAHQRDVILATQRLRDESDQLLRSHIYLISPHIDRHRPLQLDDYDELETTCIQQRLLFVREQWCANIVEHIRDSFAQADAEDGVYLHIKTREAYEGSKAQRFLSLANVLMRDTLHYLVTASAESFTRFIEASCNVVVTIRDMHMVDVREGGHPPPPPRQGHDLRPSPPPKVLSPLPPLFSIALSDDDNVAKVHYVTPPSEYIQRTLAILSRGISAMQEVALIESSVIEATYSPHSRTIDSMDTSHPLATEFKQRIETAMGRAILPLEQYLETFHVFDELMSLDVGQYIRHLEEKQLSLRELEREVTAHLRSERDVVLRIPSAVDLGAFSVNCVDIRKRLAAKCASLASKVKDIIAKRARMKADDIEERFGAIRSILIRPMETPEDTVKLREYMRSVPEQVHDLSALIQEMRDMHDVLDRFEFPLSDEDFATKWRAIGWPARLEEERQKKQQDVEQRKRGLLDAMEKAQEVFAKDVERLHKTVAGYHKRYDLKKVAEITTEVRTILTEIQRLREQANTFNVHEGLFDKEKTDYAQVHQLAKDFEPYATLWLTTDEWMNSHHQWNVDAFEAIDAEAMTNTVQTAAKNIQRCLRDPVLKDRVPIIKIAEEVRVQIEEFKPILPVMRYLRQQGMKERHWAQLSKDVGFEVRPGTTLLSLRDVTTLGLQAHEHAVMKVSEIAAREFDIESQLATMRKDWAAMKLDVKLFKSTGCYIISKETIDETQEMLDNHMLATQGLGFSPFKKVFEADIDEWDRQIKLLQSVLDEWKVCQKAWMHLEPIFLSEDIARQLPHETRRFHQVNKQWKFLTNAAHTIGNPLEFTAKTDKCLEIFVECNELLDRVQKGLNQYLENKRSSFARFYFLSDDELLTILSDAKDPQKIQPHFRKLFENIAKIDMRAPDNEMVGMFSQMKEYIPFVASVFPRKNIENWLGDIEAMMKRSIRGEMEKGLAAMSSMSRSDFVQKVPGQVALALNQVNWTAECETYLRRGSMAGYVKQAQDSLMALVEIVRQPLSPLVSMNLSGLITIEVHARDIVQSLADRKVDSPFDFEWISQLRSYWEDGDCYLRQVEAKFKYGCESLGNTTRLVITSLTDRIYLTLTGAMHMFLGSAPAGPAGTGKTETVKDLAKAVAKQCVVFNCQEGMTYASMGKFFKGLANAGAWACFDEFNRIDVEVLSVVAQQVSSLQEAARSGQYRITFEGTEILVDPTYSVFITMNPGYAGRTELPDNLKVLFRPVACMVPDYARIAEIRLFSFGYASSRKLAQKMVATFRLSSEQLSSQDHYDFGMRAVNTVISAAGLMKRQYPGEDEDILLLRALRDSNAPKFLRDDLSLFSGIITDLFPGVDVPATDYGALQKAIEKAAKDLNLQPTPLFVKKCFELFDMSILRHGQMTVGPAMGGKTAATRTLKAAMNALSTQDTSGRFSAVETYELNPKSVTMSQLYGGFDDATGEWRDGLVGELFRIAASKTTGARQWVIFDGPVDALWIESMNTVLDDNKKLCLISGEIITMSPYMNVWFEVEDLAVASPATVSRAGMIYMEPTTCIGVESFVKSWANALPSTLALYREDLQEFTNTLFGVLLPWVRQNVVEYATSTWPNLVKSCFNIFAAMCVPFVPTPRYEPPPERLDLLRELHLPIMCFAMAWSLGATGDAASRRKFDRTMREEVRRGGHHVMLPDLGSIFDFELLIEEKRWAPWTDRVPAFNKAVNAVTFADLIVPTADVARYSAICRMLLSSKFHVLCVGPTGTGKSSILSELLFSGMPSEYMPIFMTFSARTSANQTQDLIFSKFEVRRRSTPQLWGAPLNKRFVVMVDDLNMPLLDQYGAQPPIELLRQYLDYEGWFDRRTREFYFITDVVLLAAMGPPGGGRNKVTQRFMRHFNALAFPDIDEETMKRIYTTILDAFFAPFAEEVRDRVGSAVEFCVNVFGVITKELRPTPSRPHYLFNLRDLSKIAAGLLYADTQRINTDKAFAKLLLHETCRTFRDRLVDADDRAWFDELAAKEFYKALRIKVTDVAPPEQRLLFADFVKPNADVRVYEEVKYVSTLQSTIERVLEEYNRATHKKMNLVMFVDAVEHLCRIARVIKKPNGHCLLLGVGGSGRQSLSRLASFINEYDTFQVEITKGYSLLTWREDAKNMLRKCALQNKQLLFLMSDTQIIHEGMLEDINNLLNVAEVPNLFVGADLDDVFTAMKPLCLAEGISLGKVNMYARFVKSTKQNLHICLCMSPLGETFRNRIRMFPALVNCCAIDWFSAWPEEALVSVARDFFSQTDTVRDPTLLDGCISMCVYIHQSVEALAKKFLRETRRHNYVTPTSYLELLHTYRDIMAERCTQLATTKHQLLNGLEKLRQTEIQVAELQRTLELSKPVLVEKRASIERMVEQMQVETEAAEVTKRDAEGEQAVAARKKEECDAFEAQSRAILDEAMPALDKALEALESLDKKQLDEVGSYKIPTSGVKLTVQALCVLFQLKLVMRGEAGKKEPDYWQTSKDQLFSNSMALLNNLKNFHRTHIPTIAERTIQTVAPLINDPLFTPETIGKSASQACVAMCHWAHAMYTYYHVNKKVEPLRLALAEAQAESKLSEEKLAVAQARLQEVQENLQRLQAAKSKAEEDLQELERKVIHTGVKLRRADMLISGLAGEKKNWSQMAARMADGEKFLTGDLLCAAGQVCYVGPFTGPYRAELLQQWKSRMASIGIAYSSKLSVYDTLQDPIQTRKWTLANLPPDVLSIENALFLTYARRWPLMIDPQMQANRWVREFFGDQLEVVRPTQKDMIKRIEHCIRSGRHVLLENVGEELDPALDPLLQRQVFKLGGQEVIRISDVAIPWRRDFKFFMTTTIANPHYTPESMVKVTLLNFFITPIGLEDQLLGVLVGQERKELELQKNTLVQQNAAMKAEMAEIQDTILRKLDEAEGDILEDEDLIKYLDKSKLKSEELTQQLSEADATEREIDSTRELYRRTAFHGALLYFCCANLANVDPMYQYSLQWFVQLFHNGIETAERSEDLATRLSNLQAHFTRLFYESVSRSLFEKHKLMFAFVTAAQILRGDGALDEDEYRFLLQGPTAESTKGNEKDAAAQTATRSNPDPSWITDVVWAAIGGLAREVRFFASLPSSIATHTSAFKAVFMAAEAHRAILPGGWEEKVSPMQRMLIIRCLRPDGLMGGMAAFVEHHLGAEYTKPPAFDLTTSYRDSSPVTPLIFVLSPGADPYEDWKKFADLQRMSKKLADISLGQGQGPRAERLVREGVENGTWVLLQNCHLATSWMPTLERLVEGLTPSTHPQFRLWLTSMPNPHFPVPILQSGVKMTNEPPKGMRANVSRSLATFPTDFMERCAKPKEFKKLIFAMCFFHALIQERRKFGPLGWNIPYEFTSGDLSCCINQIGMFLDKYDEVQYRVIRELSGNIHYGGRVTDDWDRRTLMTILSGFVLPEVMNDDFAFSPSGRYMSIAAIDQKVYLEYVDGWPGHVEPEAFGLHANADITCAMNEAYETLETILMLQGGGGEGGGAGRNTDALVTEIAQSISTRIRGPFDLSVFQERFPILYEDSMNTVVVQEVIRYNRLLSVMKSTLQDVQLATKGLVLMSRELEEVYSSISRNAVPAMWASKAYPSLKPLAAWVTDLVQRVMMLDKWLQRGHPPAYWISGFFFPQAFLTGILQNYARRHKISIDSISYNYQWLPVRPDDITEPPSEGCYIYGMFVEGARIDTKTMNLEESFPKVLFDTAPLLWLQPVVDRVAPTDGIFVCPLYKTLRRAGTLSTTGHSTNYVLSVEIPTNTDPSHWIKRGVAMLCALNV